MSSVTETNIATNSSVESGENDVSKTPSLFDINYKIKYVNCGKASIGTILLVLYRKINSLGREWKIQDGQYEIFNHVRDFYDNINKLYCSALEVSSSFTYTELIKILFENKSDGGLWVPKDLLNMYVPSPSKFIDRCDSYELVNLLYGKIRMWSIVLKKYGYNRKFSADTAALSEIFESFASELPERKVRVSQMTVTSKNDETGEVEESMCNFEEYYEEFADLLFTNLRGIEIEKRANGKKNFSSNNNNYKKSYDSNKTNGNNSNGNNNNKGKSTNFKK